MRNVLAKVRRADQGAVKAELQAVVEFLREPDGAVRSFVGRGVDDRRAEELEHEAPFGRRVRRHHAGELVPAQLRDQRQRDAAASGDHAFSPQRGVKYREEGTTHARERTTKGRRLLRENPLTGVRLPKEKNPERPVMAHDVYLKSLEVAPRVVAHDDDGERHDEAPRTARSMSSSVLVSLPSDFSSASHLPNTRLTM